MPLPSSDLRLRVAPSLKLVDAAAWDACANPARAPGDETAAPPRPAAAAGEPALESECEPLDSPSQEDWDNPFISHAFLSSCEESGSATRRTGWGGAHLLVEDADETLLA